jgi:hypothetical protein
MVKLTVALTSCLLATCEPTKETDIDFYNNSYDRTQVYCLASNIFHEARGEEEANQIIIGLITTARAREKSISVCRAVYEWNQFSWTNEDLEASAKKRKGKEWYTSYRTAFDVYYGKYDLQGRFECVRFYKRTDNVGVSENGKKFFAKLRFVSEFGKHSAYCKK